MSDEFRINKAYAEKYNSFRQKEELQRLKDKYGNLDEESDSSTSESEDENAEALTDQVEKDWLRTLAALKSKDPKIYEKDVKFYHSDEEDTTTGSGKQQKKKKDKPVYLKDYNRQLILERGGIASDEESDNDAHKPSSLGQKLGYHEEQEKIRKSLAAAVDSSDDESSDDELLSKAEKTKAVKTEEEEEYVEWLKGQKDDLAEKEVGIELAPLKSYWNKPDLDEGEKFLKNFILNKQYIDKDEAGPSIDDEDDDEDEEEDFSEEEEILTKQETFERKYNFRFEEPESIEIKSYPRTMEDSLRRKDSSRKDKRQEVKERKQKEKEKKMEDLKQLKNLKRQEILDKIEKLKQITGNNTLGINEDDLDDDFDPKKHDEMMQKCFDEDYYGEDADGEEKPEFPDLEEAPETWDNWAGDAGNYGDMDYDQDWGQQDPHVDDEDFCMDADYDPEAARQAKQQKKQKKKKNKLAQALSTNKPVFDPEEKSFEQYFDEYYKLDYEDIIGDMPCRFKYRKVTPNNYGLSADEILKAKDKELNKWVSVKKMVQYRTEDEEAYELRAYASRGHNINKKKNILYSLFESDKPDEEGESTGQGKKKKKRKKKAAATATISQAPSDDGETTIADPESESTASKPMKHKLKETPDEDGEEEEDVPKKKMKSDVMTEDVSEAVNQEKAEGKKGKKKKKKKQTAAGTGDTVENKKQTAAGTGDTVENNVTVAKDNTKQGAGETGGVKQKKKNKGDGKLKLSDERLKAYGINPKKYKYMQKEELHQIKPRKDNQKVKFDQE